MNEINNNHETANGTKPVLPADVFQDIALGGLCKTHINNYGFS